MELLTIGLDFSGKVVLYEQIYRHIRAEIERGGIRSGERLPSKRALAAHLRVSQSTVETAYGMLQAEGYVQAQPKRGFFAQSVAPVFGAVDQVKNAPHDQSESDAYTEDADAIDCATSGVDPSVFPYASWAKLTKETVYQNPHLLQRGDGQGDRPFRAAIADFLHQYRGVQCSAEQIVIGAGMQTLMALLVQLLPRHTRFALEDPGYGATYRTLQAAERDIVPIPVGAEGMEVDALLQSGADVACVTPSHQFPTGVRMPIGRRSELLLWAGARPGRYLIEDDYDSEFRYSSRPIPAMQGLEHGGRVIYMGTFSRTIAPSIRTAYMVLPPALLARYHERGGDATVSRLEQETISRFLVDGLYVRHLRRSTNLYRQKQQQLIGELQTIAGLQVSGHEAGLHLLVTVDGRAEQDLFERARAHGVLVRPLGLYSHGAPYRAGTVVFGFAGLSGEEIAQVGARLRRAWGCQ